jgi:hypothetical protein
MQARNYMGQDPPTSLPSEIPFRTRHLDSGALVYLTSTGEYVFQRDLEAASKLGEFKFREYSVAAKRALAGDQKALDHFYVLSSQGEEDGLLVAAILGVTLVGLVLTHRRPKLKV